MYKIQIAYSNGAAFQAGLEEFKEMEKHEDHFDQFLGEIDIPKLGFEDLKLEDYFKTEEYLKSFKDYIFEWYDWEIIFPYFKCTIFRERQSDILPNYYENEFSFEFHGQSEGGLKTRIDIIEANEPITEETFWELNGINNQICAYSKGATVEQMLTSLSKIIPDEIIKKEFEKRGKIIDEKRIITCVYCGLAYPDETPTHGAKVLTEHIKICEKHPMRDAEKTISKLRKALSDLIGANEKEELEKLEMVVRSMPGIEKDKIDAINAIHVLIETS